ncbi:MAG: squalene/phytoene synthase family protein, partial [Planctomycetota bacterium]
MTVSEAPITRLLERMGPERCERMSEGEARAWCSALAGGRYENFPVLTALRPEGVRDDFGAIYAFCRWADDLGDEAGDPARALELLGWWRSELQACFAGEPRHPVFVALRPTVLRHALPIEPFDHL